MTDPTRTAAFATPVYITGNSGSQINPTPPTPPPATIVSSGNWNSGVIPANGAKLIAASAELTQAGTLTLQRYIDAAGTIAIGNAITQALTANIVGTVATANDGIPFAAFSIVVTNTSGSTATLSNVNILTGV